MSWVCFKVGDGTNDPPMPRFFRFGDVETVLLGRAFGSGHQQGDLTVNLAVHVRLYSGLEFQIELREGRSFLKSFKHFIEGKPAGPSVGVFFADLSNHGAKARDGEPGVPEPKLAHPARRGWEPHPALLVTGGGN